MKFVVRVKCCFSHFNQRKSSMGTNTNIIREGVFVIGGAVEAGVHCISMKQCGQYAIRPANGEG